MRFPQLVATCLVATAAASPFDKYVRAGRLDGRQAPQVTTTIDGPPELDGRQAPQVTTTIDGPPELDRRQAPQVTTTIDGPPELDRRQVDNSLFNMTLNRSQSTLLQICAFEA
ncbi:MAG: hypothetical protein LQ351_006590 [Letrouitia transgressa]|nr:MAG: hypothetical protein LQ351_006590 [Letrouitia transgressa]